jgi:hypothetical protein
MSAMIFNGLSINGIPHAMQHFQALYAGIEVQDCVVNKKEMMKRNHDAIDENSPSSSNIWMSLK